MIAEYKTKLIDKSILQRKLAELYDIAEEEVKTLNRIESFENVRNRGVMWLERLFNLQTIDEVLWLWLFTIKLILVRQQFILSFKWQWWKPQLYTKSYSSRKYNSSSSSGSSTDSSSSSYGSKKYYHDSYDDGYDDVYMDGDYDYDRYDSDDDYAAGVDDAIDDDDEDW